MFCWQWVTVEGHEAQNVMMNTLPKEHVDQFRQPALFMLLQPATPVLRIRLIYLHSSAEYIRLLISACLNSMWQVATSVCSVRTYQDDTACLPQSLVSGYCSLPVLATKVFLLALSVSVCLSVCPHVTDFHEICNLRTSPRLVILDRGIHIPAAFSRV
jgi:hypothetical protein